ncbi:MAG: dihydroneopterin aldolase [Candidatus Zixiibacteriota bacterium]
MSLINMGVIRLHNMTFYGYHGVSAAERQTGRRFEVDIELAVDMDKAAASDRLQDTVNYTEVYRTVEELVAQDRFSLLETIAVRLAEEILKKFEPKEVTVRVRKKIPPVPGNLDHIEVEIKRAFSSTQSNES